MSIENQGDKPVDQCEIHTVKIIEHLKTVDVPIWDTAALKSAIQQKVSEIITDTIGKAGIADMIKEAIKAATKDLVVYNAVKQDISVDNAVITNVPVTNAIITDEVLDLVNLLQRQKK